MAVANSSPWRNGAALRGSAILALSWTFAAAVAGAQPTAVAAEYGPHPERAEAERPSSDILVIGRRQASPAEVGRFVGAVLAEAGNDRVPRWADRLCVNVAGVDANTQNGVMRRIEAVARSLSLQVRRRHCDPSATIVFTSDPGALLARIERDRPAFFGAIPRSERDALAASTAPVRWLSWAQLRGASGETPFSFYVDPKSGGVERPVPALRTIPSRLQTGSRMDLQSMFVVVDVSKVPEDSTRWLPAYLAMVVFGNIRQQHGRIGAPTILDLFDENWQPGETTRNGLTHWDESYLQSLYSGNWNMPSAQRRGIIQASMMRDLNGGRREPPIRRTDLR